MTTHDEVRTRVRRRLTELLRDQMGDTEPFADDESLVLSGRLESLGVVNVITFLEEEFQVSIDPSDFELTKFDSVDSITSLVSAG
jgi:acyl carrier protein